MVPERDPAATALNGLLPLRREYTQAWHGFDRNEVRQYLDHVEAQLRRVLSERAAPGGAVARAPPRRGGGGPRGEPGGRGRPAAGRLSGSARRGAEEAAGAA